MSGCDLSSVRTMVARPVEVRHNLRLDVRLHEAHADDVFVVSRSLHLDPRDERVCGLRRRLGKDRLRVYEAAPARGQVGGVLPGLMKLLPLCGAITASSTAAAGVCSILPASVGPGSALGSAGVGLRPGLIPPSTSNSYLRYFMPLVNWPTPRGKSNETAPEFRRADPTPTPRPANARRDTCRWRSRC